MGMIPYAFYCTCTSKCASGLNWATCRGAWGSGGLPVAPKTLFLTKLTWYPRIEVDLGVVAKRRVRPLLGLSDPLVN